MLAENRMTKAMKYVEVLHVPWVQVTQQLAQNIMKMKMSHDKKECLQTKVRLHRLTALRQLIVTSNNKMLWGLLTISLTFPSLASK